MADYFTPTVVQPTIPIAAMTPLERLLLTRIFEAEPDGDGLYIFAEEGPADTITVNRGELDAALADFRPPTARRTPMSRNGSRKSPPTRQSSISISPARPGNFCSRTSCAVHRPSTTSQ